MPLPFAVTSDTPLTCCQLAGQTGQEHAHEGFRRKVSRWIVRGVLISGRRVKLRATRVGGKWLVRWGDYQAFEAACTRAAGVEPTADLPTAADLKRDSDAARRVRDEFRTRVYGRANRKAG